MPDVLAQVLALPGLGWLAAAAFVSGTVRGFAGFGTALIYMPVAAQVLPPFWALASVALMDVFGPLPNVPAALKIANRADLLRLLAGTMVALPMGLWALGYIETDLFRYAVSGIALLMLAVLATGVRYTGRLSPGLVFGTGALAGGCGGLTGVPGPPVILLYMASPHPATVVRASTLLYLYFYDMVLLSAMLVMGHLALAPALVGVALIVPNMLGNILGAALFRPGLETIYRWIAYTIIAASALAGLPIWN